MSNESFPTEFGLDGAPVNRFSFVYLKNKKYNSFSDKNTQELLMKWSMKDQLQLQTYAFVEPFNQLLYGQFVYDFFNHPLSINTLNGFPNLPSSSTGTITSLGDIKITPVNCSITCMSIFDPLLDPENGITRGGGFINKCMEEDIDGLLVADQLRHMLVNHESPHYELFPKEHREEFIFKLFEHFALGGLWCQYEDTIQPYLDITKGIYKDIISLHKKKDYDELEITSKVFQIEVKNESGVTVFPPKAHHKQNFAYFIVEPNKREMITMTHHFGGTFPVVH